MIGVIVVLICILPWLSANAEVYIDDLNTKVEINSKPQRVVALNASNLEMLLAFRANIVGRPEKTGMTEGLYERVKGIDDIGHTANPSLEKIVSLRPDLVVGNAVSFHQALVPSLKEAGIKTLLVSIKDYDDIFSKIRLFGRVFRDERTAEEIIKGIKQETAEVKALTKGKGDKRVLVIWGSPQSFSMATAQSFVGSLLKELKIANISAGLKMPTNSPYIPLNLEYALSKDPDAIFIITMGNPETMRQKAIRELEKSGAWSAFRAVRENRVYYLPYELFTVNPSLRVADAMRHLVITLYEGQ